MFSCYAVEVLLDPVTEKMVQVQLGHMYVSYEAVPDISRSGYVHGRIVSNMKDYDEKRNIIQNTSVSGTIYQRIFACVEFGSIKAMISSFVLIEENLGVEIDSIDSEGTTIVLFKGASGTFRKEI